MAIGTTVNSPVVVKSSMEPGTRQHCNVMIQVYFFKNVSMTIENGRTDSGTPVIVERAEATDLDCQLFITVV